MNPPKITILGGGVCGLYAAHQALSLGAEVTLFEKAPTYGGLAAGHQFDGNWFDLGVHMLHAFDEEIFATCKNAMGSERIEVPLKSHIRWGGKLYHYPLRGRDILAGIPPVTLARCLTGLFLAEVESRYPSRQPGEDAESALIELYGSPLYEFFFEDFTHRYWEIHPRDLSAEFVRRKMPRLSAIDVLKNLLEKLRLAKPRDATEGALRFETLHYSCSGSESLPRTLAAHAQGQGAQLHTNSPITQISHDGDSIQSIITPNGSNGTSETQYLSTIPLPQLVQSFFPAPPAPVLEAAAALRFKPMTVYALLVKKEQCMEALYTYYRDRLFHRVGEPKNAGLLVKPAGHTTLIVETTCEKDDPKWRGEALPQILSDLAAEGLCQPKDVVSHHLIHSEHAYPIFAKGFEGHLQTITDYLASFKNLRTTGRQGGFTYPNMHSAMRMGAEAAKELLES
ncbi:MAG: FAD-dependent oxidoreductase [Roseibacillus sp.]